jgi:hypothetical protein
VGWLQVGRKGQAPPGLHYLGLFGQTIKEYQLFGPWNILGIGMDWIGMLLFLYTCKMFYIPDHVSFARILCRVEDLGAEFK